MFLESNQIQYLKSLFLMMVTQKSAIFLACLLHLNAPSLFSTRLPFGIFNGTLFGGGRSVRPPDPTSELRRRGVQLVDLD